MLLEIFRRRSHDFEAIYSNDHRLCMQGKMKDSVASAETDEAGTQKNINRTEERTVEAIIVEDEDLIAAKLSV